jgi:light-regulated signal transduction histidine kinase (bacteriophytochrome)
VRHLGQRQRQLEARVAERTAALAAINQELEAFSYSASHDLRAPLRTIDGFSRALLASKSQQLDDEGRQLLGRMQEDSRRMQRLVDDMLTLSRAGRAELRIAPVDLTALATSILGEMREREPGRQITTAVAPGLAVEADPSLLRIALANLLENAWKFTARTDDARIEVGAEDRAGEDRVYFVRDSGAGFDPRYAHKLFVAFQRLHAPKEFEGTGVGLATVLRIVQRHGGRIWAEGRPGEGATFYFTLPSRIVQST